jgi:cysteinyl-tRNA synthetase
MPRNQLWSAADHMCPKIFLGRIFAHRRIAAAVLLACVLCAAASVSAQTLPAAAPSPARLLAAAKSWGYQLQDIDPDILAAAPYDMLVIDYSRNGSAALALTADEVDKLKIKPDGDRRIVLAYLSIGEAESYRYYWKWHWGWLPGLFAPAWLGSENAEWRRNYGVRYWHEDWQRIIFGGDDSYLERIIRAGFDGVYLDRVDQYVEMIKENPNARALMIAFVKALAERARALKPGFLVVPQNGEDLLTDPAYLAVIDGFGKEDLLFGEDNNQERNDPRSIRANVSRLKLVTADHKPVFVVEYLDDARQIERARARIEDWGFIPYFAARALDRMRIGDLPGPSRKPEDK